MNSTTQDIPVLLTIGSNARDARRRVNEACDYLRGIIASIHFSDAICAPSYTGVGADYVNIAVTGTCTCSSEALHRELRRYEDTHGRHRPDLHGDVAIDIDIVTYGEDVLKPADMAQPWLGRALELIHDC